MERRLEPVMGREGQAPSCGKRRVGVGMGVIPCQYERKTNVSLIYLRLIGSAKLR